MNQSVETSVPSPTPPPPRVAIVSALWHADIVAHARDAVLNGLARQEVPPSQVDCFDVPGAYEIPLKAQRLAASGRYGAVVGIALVVDGGIYHQEFVAGTVVDAMMRVMLDTGVPVVNVVLAPHRFHEHEEHQRFFTEHFAKKGSEAADACLHWLRDRDDRPQVPLSPGSAAKLKTAVY